LRSDSGFEDREGHQAPFTLRIADCRLPIADWARSTIENLFEFFDRADDGVKVRPVTGVEFGMDEFAIGANFKCATARGKESKRFDALAEIKNFGRQTDGLWGVVSNHAIFDRYLSFHLALLSTNMVRTRIETVKKTAGERKV
jgi:hypothetical protein